MRLLLEDKPLKFQSIRKKLIYSVSLILALSFIGLLSSVAFLNVGSSEKNLESTEESIRDSLLAKGRTLITNNSQALSGMVDDNAFSAVLDLVSSTVKGDSDIIYGIYMDIDKQPWVNANQDNESGVVSGNVELVDDVSIWASLLEEQDFNEIELGGNRVYEFAAPVIMDDEILGHIRYGFTTENMVKQVTLARDKALVDLIQALTILVGVGLLALVIGYMATRKMAFKITMPLGSLTKAATNIAKGDYESPVEVDSNDEIGVLSDNFNTMRVTIQKKMKDLSELNETGESLAVTQDQRKALEEVLKTMNQHCNVVQGSIYLFNSNNKLTLEAFYPPKSIESDRLPKDFDEGEGIIGHCVKEKKIIFVNNTLEHELFVDNENGQQLSLLCVPLIDNDIVIGAMNFSGRVGDVVFEDSDHEYAASLARSLVITIKNINMIEVIEEQNRTLEQKVEDRTAALREKTNDILNMMHNMHQGLFTVVNGNKIHPEYASYLEEIFETKHISERNIMDLMFSECTLGNDVINQVETAISALIGADEMMFDFNKHCLVGEFTKEFSDGRKKILELDWDPILADGEIDKLMVTVRDVTALKALQAEAEEQKRELEIIGQIIALDREKFCEFIQTSRQFILDCRKLITQTESKDLDAIGLLFRNMHTVKGNARTYGFSYITDSVHDVESSYDSLRKDESVQWNQSQLLDELDRAEIDIEHYANTAKTKLDIHVDQESDSGGSTSGIDAESLSKVLQSYSEIKDSHTLPADVVTCLNQSLRMLARVDSKSLSEVLDDVFESLPSLASQLDKPVPNVDIDDGDVFLRSSSFGMLNNIFMHVIRNSIDHGIEEAKERDKKGKSKEGNISISARIEENQMLEIKVSDDGRGLNLGKLREKAEKEGLLTGDELSNVSAVANVILNSGMSTAEKLTDVSGRGVGMDAVKGFLEDAGGSIDVVLVDADNLDNDVEFASFYIKLHIPQEMYIDTALGGSKKVA